MRTRMGRGHCTQGIVFPEANPLGCGVISFCRSPRSMRKECPLLLSVSVQPQYEMYEVIVESHRS